MQCKSGQLCFHQWAQRPVSSPCHKAERSIYERKNGPLLSQYIMQSRASSDSSYRRGKPDKDLKLLHQHRKEDQVCRPWGSCQFGLLLFCLLFFVLLGGYELWIIFDSPQPSFEELLKANSAVSTFLRQTAAQVMVIGYPAKLGTSTPEVFSKFV